MKRWNVFAPDDGVTGAVPAAPLTEPAPAQEEPEVAKYTDKQLNDLIAKNAAKAAEKARRNCSVYRREGRQRDRGSQESKRSTNDRGREAQG